MKEKTEMVEIKSNGKEEKELAVPWYSLDIAPDRARESLRVIREFQAVVRAEMIEGHDYGVIPGTERPTLLKPGAEKLAKLLMCSDQYAVMEKREDWDKPFFYYMMRCSLISMSSGVTVSEGIGSANSMESKWRWRWMFGSEVPENIDKKTLTQRKFFSKKTKKEYIQYRVENEDIFSLVNTIQKMAKKRALIDAALSAGRLSDLFTQDIEDLKADEVEVKDTEGMEEKEGAPEPAENKENETKYPQKSEKVVAPEYQEAINGAKKGTNEEKEKVLAEIIEAMSEIIKKGIESKALLDYLHLDYLVTDFGQLKIEDMKKVKNMLLIVGHNDAEFVKLAKRIDEVHAWLNTCESLGFGHEFMFAIVNEIRNLGREVFMKFRLKMGFTKLYEIKPDRMNMAAEMLLGCARDAGKTEYQLPAELVKIAEDDIPL